MNASKFIAATVTAASVLGGVGYAYAQSASPAASSATSQVPQPMTPSTQSAPMDTTMPNGRSDAGSVKAPSVDTMGTPRNDMNTNAPTRRDASGVPVERAARADRN